MRFLFIPEKKKRERYIRPFLPAGFFRVGTAVVVKTKVFCVQRSINGKKIWTRVSKTDVRYRLYQVQEPVWEPDIRIAEERWIHLNPSRPYTGAMPDATE